MLPTTQTGRHRRFICSGSGIGEGVIMDLSSILSLVSGASDTVSSKSGSSSSDVEKVIAAALPSILSGMHATSKSDEGAEKITKALEKHGAKDTKKAADEADASEGEEIISTLLGSKSDDVKNTVSSSTGVSAEQVTAILAAAAPVIMSALGSQHKETASKTASSSDNISNLLTSVLGAATGSSSSAGGLDIASLAGSLIGSFASSSKTTSKKSKKSTKKAEENVAAELISGLTGLFTGK